MNAKRWVPACAAVAVLAAVMASAASGAEWVAGDPIAGLGDISKTSPTGPSSNNLHYGGTNNAETAKFQLDTANATDYDTCAEDPGVELDAGLCEADTEWSCSTGAGTMDQGEFSSEFTPGNDVKSGITIDAKVYEGHEYSYTDGNHDVPVEVQWDYTLSTFIVGVKMDPGNVKYYEDCSLGGDASGSEETEKMIHLWATNAMECNVDWTSLPGCPGQVTDPGSYPSKNLTWKAIAETDGGSVGGIMGTIHYGPKITVSGEYECRGGGSGVPDPGSYGTLLVTLAGVASPYAGAAASIVVTAAGSRTHFKWALAAETVIENYENAEIDESEIAFTGSGVTEIDLSSLSLSTSIAADVNDELKGSVDMEGLAEVYDDSVLNNGKAVVECSDLGQTYFGSPKPYYTTGGS